MSRLFAPFRTVGVVCDDVPVVVTKAGKETFITAAIGLGFQVFKCDKLSLALVSPQTRAQITALGVARDVTFTAVGSDILVWKRVKQTDVLSGHHTATVRWMLVMGDVLLSLDEAGHLVLWDIRSLACTSEFDTDVTPATLMHPPTYLNKIVIGTTDGRVQIWNIRTQRLVHTCAAVAGVPITTIVESPVVDVVGIGRQDGSIILFNLRQDAVIATLHLKDGAVSALSFCTDAFREPPLLVSGSSRGQVCCWDLNAKALVATVRDAHDAGVTSLEFLLGEPSFLSVGADNAVKQWVLDNLDGQPRLLRMRCGHKAPPTRIRYHSKDAIATLADGTDASCCEVLSAGQDRTLRVFHTVLDQQNRELSQGSVAKQARKFHMSADAFRLPPILAFDMSDRRTGDWCNIISAHEGESKAYIWNFENRAIGQHVLPLPNASERVTAVCVSTCGNFGIVGGAAGTIARFNMQSALKRGTYPHDPSNETVGATHKAGMHSNPLANPHRPMPAPQTGINLARSLRVGLKGMDLPIVDAAAGKHGDRKADDEADDSHTGAVTGLVTDALNKLLISTGVDGTMRFWDLHTHQPLHVLQLGSPIHALTFHRESGLCATVGDDLEIRVVDTVARRVVRRFRGHKSVITDLTFSMDARWLVTAAMDGQVRVWDVPTARCIDCLQFKQPVTSVTMAPTGEFLATAHVGSVGISLWASKAYYSDVIADTEVQQPYPMDLPAPGSVESAQAMEADVPVSAASTKRPLEEEPVADDEDVFKHPTAAPLSGCVVTLSRLPKAHWANLPYLDIIQARNKPVEPPKAAPQAPFFIPTVSGVMPQFAPLPASALQDTSDSKAAPGPKSGQDTKQAPGDEPDADNDHNGDDADDQTPWTSAWTDDGDGDADASEGEESKAPSAPATMSRILSSSGPKKLRRARCRFALLLESSGLALVNLEKAADIASARRHLEQGADLAILNQIAVHLASLSPSKLDVELRSLCYDEADEEGVRLVGQALDFFTWQLVSGVHFELCQAHINVMLRAHRDAITSSSVLQQKAANVSMAHKLVWPRLQSLLQHTTCMISFLANLQQ